MFGISFWEMMLVGVVALIFVGPEKLPKMLHTLGRWANKLRRMTNEVRHQSGIDDILRQGGIQGGLDEIRELRNLVRGNVAGLAAGALKPPAPPAMIPATAAASPSVPAPSGSHDISKAITADRSREYPLEGCDAAGAIADDLWSDGNEEAMAEETLRVSQAPGPPPAEGTSDAKESGDAGSADATSPDASPTIEATGAAPAPSAHPLSEPKPVERS